MKILSSYKILILLLILISFSLIAFSLYQNGRLRLLRKFFTKTETLPTSYQECDERFPKIGNFNPADFIFPFCNYFVEEINPGERLFDECLSKGGEIFGDNEGCELKFYKD